MFLIASRKQCVADVDPDLALHVYPVPTGEGAAIQSEFFQDPFPPIPIQRPHPLPPAPGRPVGYCGASSPRIRGKGMYAKVEFGIRIRIPIGPLGTNFLRSSRWRTGLSSTSVVVVDPLSEPSGPRFSSHRFRWGVMCLLLSPWLQARWHQRRAAPLPFPRIDMHFSSLPDRPPPRAYC